MDSKLDREYIYIDLETFKILRSSISNSCRFFHISLKALGINELILNSNVNLSYILQKSSLNSRWVKSYWSDGQTKYVTKITFSFCSLYWSACLLSSSSCIINSLIFFSNFLKKVLKSVCFKWTYGISGNDYKVVALFKLYPTVMGIIMQSLK